jgi:transcriptional regulator with XRE-family HTH domain
MPTVEPGTGTRVLRITQERQVQGLSQARLARRAGFDPSWLSKVEGGWVRPYPRQLRRLARALRLPPGSAVQLLDEIERTPALASVETLGKGANAGSSSNRVESRGSGARDHGTA